MSFDGVLMRSRASAAASAIRAISATSMPSGGTSRTVGRVRLAVAAEAVAAEREGERRQPRIVRRIGEAIDARRQQARQRAGPEQVAGFGGLVLEPENDLRDLPVGRGQRQAFAGLGGKVVGCRKLPGLFGKSPGDHASQVVLVAKVIGMAAASGAVSNRNCMRVSWKGTGRVVLWHSTAN